MFLRKKTQWVYNVINIILKKKDKNRLTFSFLAIYKNKSFKRYCIQVYILNLLQCDLCFKISEQENPEHNQHWNLQSNQTYIHVSNLWQRDTKYDNPNSRDLTLRNLYGKFVNKGKYVSRHSISENIIFKIY